MGGIVEVGEAILSRSQRSLEVVAQNISNSMTPGYKAARNVMQFSSVLNVGRADVMQRPGDVVDLSDGKLIRTGDPYDFAIEGPGFFELLSEGAVFYSRNGQFVRDESGRLTTSDGFTVRGDSGDIVVHGEISVTADGVVLDDNVPVARLVIAQLENGGSLSSIGNGLLVAADDQITEISSAVILQGWREASNVNTGSEMIAMLAAIRQAEAGQRLVQVYDDLIGKAVTAFGQGASG